MKPTGADLIAAERKRQQRAEGFTLADDDRYRSGELNDAAVAYAVGAAMQARGRDIEELPGILLERGPIPWPWEEAWLKFSEDPVRNLVKAGALLAAEIDRIQRTRP